MFARLLTLLWRWLRSRGRGPRLCLGSIPLLPLLSLPYSLHGGQVLTHKHVMGLTGMGKSKYLASLASQLILQGEGVAVVDPHSDLVQDILALLVSAGYYAREDALRRVWYVDFANPTRFIPFNILQAPSPPYEIARNLVEAVTRAWPSLSGGAAPQFENLLLAASSVLIDNHLPLTALTPLLTDARYRASLLANVRDPQVVRFFTSRYDTGAKLNESTLRRAFLLTYPPPLRYSLGQQENRLAFRSLMDQRVSLLCDLGGLDAQTQRILGCLLTVGFEQAALSRANIPPQARRPYHLFLDEFSQFAAQSSVALERVLAQARKYGLFLTLAHQTFSQLGASLDGALQNTLFVAFRLGPSDLSFGAQRVGPFDPYRIKYWARATPSQPTHPVYQTKAEQQNQWAYTLQHLRPRHILVRIGERTIYLRTPSVPPERPAIRQAVERLRQRYSQELLVPAADETTQVSQPEHVEHGDLVYQFGNAAAPGVLSTANTSSPHVPASSASRLSRQVPLEDTA